MNAIDILLPLGVWIVITFAVCLGVLWIVKQLERWLDKTEQWDPYD